ncbi:MAG TPA: hypothetical protein PLR20_07650 [Syntrophales bacterium]|jgi:hypothetical protein|nr:hypothetical protein [Syntrophales bacterium]HOX93333.1 hypothetical protein [Syntrophales bacterium]HPI56534.1 hypothetical protein [Syntrophales bacterium]HPN25045.1 hypothetical protein [Syntrophales bacterium]HQM29212.1 hypothetical protein [Syntrophales bacterium]
MAAVRISPEEAYQKVKDGRAILVCAYADEEKFGKMRLDMAISFGDFQRRLPTLPRDQEIIFY